VKAFFTKYWRRLRFTDADAERVARHEALNVAMHYETKRIDQLLRGAQMVFDWKRSGTLPPESPAGDAAS
jgi:hypothetical protein